MRVHKAPGAAMIAAIALTGCAPTVMAPTVPVMPGQNKPFDQFTVDQQACQGYASAQTAPLSAQANQALGGALLTTALGAGLGAAIGGGRGAAIGAASGALVRVRQRRLRGRCRPRPPGAYPPPPPPFR